MPDLDVTDEIHSFDRGDLGPDELYDVRQELLDLGEREMAIRVDIEYGNSLRYDDYRPKFVVNDLVKLVLFLGNARYRHVMAGNRQRADAVEDVAVTISEHFETWADEHDVPLEQYIGLDLGSRIPDAGRDHAERMQRAKHDPDVEADVEHVEVEVEEGGLEDLLPSAVEEKELNPKPQEPDSPGDEPGIDDGDGPDDPEGA